MKSLDQLPEIASHSLGGLTADQNLKYRIERAAREGGKAAKSPRRVWVPALCTAVVLTVGLAFGIPALTRPAVNTEELVIFSQRAGEAVKAAPKAAASLPEGSITLNNSGCEPQYRSIWAGSDGSTFPLIGAEGRYYRMLNNPTSIDDTLLGASLGAVSEFTTEPALSGGEVILSNKAEQGADVYAISGMDGTLVAAKVDGVYRVFQRVSFSGNAVKGNETLADTLQVRGHVQAVELSGVGTVTDQTTAESLVDTLLDNASYESSGSITGKQSLLIQLDNGLTVQLTVKDDKVSACGTWSCPEFIEAFAAAAE